MGESFKTFTRTVWGRMRAYPLQTTIALLVLIIIALLLSGCTTTPMQSAQPARDRGAFAVATLAPWGSFEWQAAPGYTRLALARRAALRMLQDGRIDVHRAREIQTAADEARKQLDAARSASDLGDQAGAHRALELATERVEEVEGMVREARR